MKESTTIRADGVDIRRWERAANLSGLSYSEWARRALNEAAAGRRKIEPEEYLGVSAEPQKNSKPEFTHQTYALPVGTLPRKTPIRRKHLPEIHNPERTPGGRGINVREDVEEKPAKKFRCTYLWPSNSKKCPRCGQVHSDV